MHGIMTRKKSGNKKTTRWQPRLRPTELDGSAPSAQEENPAEPVLQFDELSKVFFKGGTPIQALHRVTLDIAAGELLAIVGPSGCGKSTLLNLAAGLMSPAAGEVRYRGAPVRSVNTHVSYVTQKDNLLPWRTVAQNVALPLELAPGKAVNRRQRADLVQQYTELVGLGAFEKHYPGELSGGMRKRVSLARALVCEPDILLMDEPFGALDAQLKLVLAAELLKAWESTRRTLVFVTHDLAEAIAIADRVIVMSAHPGQVRVVESIQLPRPRDVYNVRLDEQFELHHQRLWDALRPTVQEATTR